MRKHSQRLESIGIIKELDNLGRLVIPKELRTLYNLDNEVEVIATEKGVLVRNPEYRLVKIVKNRFN